MESKTWRYTHEVLPPNCMFELNKRVNQEVGLLTVDPLEGYAMCLFCDDSVIEWWCDVCEPPDLKCGNHPDILVMPSLFYHSNKEAREVYAGRLEQRDRVRDMRGTS